MTAYRPGTPEGIACCPNGQRLTGPNRAIPSLDLRALSAGERSSRGLRRTSFRRSSAGRRTSACRRERLESALLADDGPGPGAGLRAGRIRQVHAAGQRRRAPRRFPRRGTGSPPTSRARPRSSRTSLRGSAGAWSLPVDGRPSTICLPRSTRRPRSRACSCSTMCTRSSAARPSERCRRSSTLRPRERAGRDRQPAPARHQPAAAARGRRDHRGQQRRSALSGLGGRGALHDRAPRAAVAGDARLR